MLVEGLLDKIRARLAILRDDAPLIEAARLLRVGTDIVIVCDPAGTLTGVITKGDVVGQISTCQGASCVTRASLVMTRNVIMCRPGDWLHEVWAIMKQRQLKNIPVIDSGTRPIGVLNARDALDGLLGQVENEEALLRDYVMGMGYR